MAAQSEQQNDIDDETKDAEEFEAKSLSKKKRNITFKRPGHIAESIDSEAPAPMPKKHHEHHLHATKAKAVPAPVPKSVKVEAPEPAPAAPVPIVEPIKQQEPTPAPAPAKVHVEEKTTSTQAENIIADGITESPDIDKAEAKFDDFANGADRFDPDDTTSKPKLGALVQKASDDALDGDSDSQVAKMLKSTDNQPLNTADDIEEPIVSSDKEKSVKDDEDPNFNKEMMKTRVGEPASAAKKMKKEMEKLDKDEAKYEEKTENVVKETLQKPEKDFDDANLKDSDNCEPPEIKPIVALSQQPKKTKKDKEAEDKAEEEEDTIQEKEAKAKELAKARADSKKFEAAEKAKVLAKKKA